MEESVPKNVFTYLKAKPEEEIYEICITLTDAKGAVAEAAKILSEASVNIKTSILFGSTQEEKTGYWTSFIDVSGTTKNIEKIVQDLEKSKMVQRVKAVKPEPVAYDVIHFPIIHGESAALVMPVELFGSLFDEIEKILTPSGFAAVFYNAGKKSGSFMAELLAERHGLRGRSLASALAQATQAIGWGKIEDVQLDMERPFCRVRVRSCFEALLRGHRTEQMCHWTRGFVAGFLSEIIDEPLEATEVKCMATGHELCEFEATPRI